MLFFHTGMVGSFLHLEEKMKHSNQLDFSLLSHTDILMFILFHCCVVTVTLRALNSQLKHFKIIFPTLPSSGQLS